MFSKTKWLWLSLPILTLMACGGGGGSDSDDTGSSTSAFKLVAASADAPQLRVRTDNDPNDNNVPRVFPTEPTYGQTVTVSLSGRQRFTIEYIVPEGATTEVDYESAMDSFDLELATERRYEMYVMGEYPDGDYWLADMPLEFDEADEQARVTFAHAAAGMGALDFHLVEPGSEISSASLMATLEPRSMDHSTRVDPGSYELKITESGSLDVLYTSGELSFTAGGNTAGNDITLAALANAWIKPGVTNKPPVVVSYSSNAVSELMFGADSGVELRLFHASSNAGALDVAVDDDFSPPLVEDLTLGELTDYFSLESGVHNFKVTPADTGTAKIDNNFNLFNSIAWTMIVHRPWDNLARMFMSENARPIGGYARVRVAHVSEERGAVNLYITEEGADLEEENEDGDPIHEPRVTNLRRNTASGYMAIAPGTYELNLTRTSNRTVVQGPITATFAAGEVYTLVLLDEADMETVTHAWLDADPESDTAP